MEDGALGAQVPDRVLELEEDHTQASRPRTEQQYIDEGEDWILT